MWIIARVTGGAVRRRAFEALIQMTLRTGRGGMFPCQLEG